MEKHQKIIRLILNCIIVLFLSGCWDQEELDQRAYVLGIGLDKGETEGDIKVTYIISNPEVGSTQQGGGEQEPSHEILSFDASSFIHSQDIANAVVAKDITYDILDIFVVSEELARSKDFIRWMYDATKDREIRRDTNIIITKEKASDFIKKNKPKLETRRHEYFEIMLKNAREVGLIPNSEVHNYFRIVEADADLFITAYATTKDTKEKIKNTDSQLIAGKFKVEGETNAAEFLGAAVFKEGQMIGTLSVEETRIVQLVNVMLEKSSFLTSLKDPFMDKYEITLRFTQLEKPKVNIDVKGKSPKIDIRLPLRIEVLTDHSMVNYAKDRNKRDELQEYLKTAIEERIVAFINRTQEEFKGQPFTFSLAARRNFLTIQQWKEYDWMKSYPNADVTVNVEVTFGEFGRQSELPDYRKVRD